MMAPVQSISWLFWLLLFRPTLITNAAWGTEFKSALAMSAAPGAAVIVEFSEQACPLPPDPCPVDPEDIHDIAPAWSSDLKTVEPSADSELSAEMVPEAAPNDGPAAPQQAGVAAVSLSTDIGCGPGATIGIGETMTAHIQAAQTGNAELVWHRPDGDQLVWSGVLAAGQRFAVGITLLATSTGGTRVLRLRMASARAQAYCGFTIRVQSNALCGWLRPAGGWCAGGYATSEIVSCADGREYIVSTALPHCASPTGYYVFSNPRYYWNSLCQQNILVGYGSASCLGGLGPGASCRNCPSGTATGTVNIWTDKGRTYGCDGTYRPGEAIAVYLRAAQSGYAEVFNYWADGQVKHLALGYLQAGATYRILDVVQAPPGRQVLLFIMRGSMALDYCSYIVSGGGVSGGGITTYNGRLGAFVQGADMCPFHPLLNCAGNTTIAQLSTSQDLTAYVGQFVAVETRIDICGSGIAGQPLWGPFVTRIRTIADPCQRTPRCDASTLIRMPNNPVAGRPFSIDISGESASTCTPRYHGYSVSGNRIVLEIDDTSCGNIMCGWAITPWSISARIGRPLQPGTYTVILRWYCNRSDDCIGPTFTVAGSPAAAHETPAASGGGAAVLGTDDADLGFRPDVNGFGFANRQLIRDRAMFEQVFGKDQVACRAAQRYFATTYHDLGGAWSSLGFSTASLLAYLGLEQPHAGAFAVARTDRLGAAPETPALDNAIAFYSGTQISRPFLDAYLASRTACASGGMAALLDRLRAGIASRQPNVLALRFDDGPGFHAVVPYKIEDVGADFTDVYVYDSEVPGLERVLHVDRIDGAWEWSYGFRGGLKEQGLRTGGCTDLAVVPLSAIVGAQTPLVTLCAASPAAGGAVGDVVVQLSHDGLIRDGGGRRAGVAAGEIHEEITGAVVLPRAWGPDDASSYGVRLPRADYTVTSGASDDTPIRAAAVAEGRSLVVMQLPRFEQPGSPFRMTAALDRVVIDDPSTVAGLVVELSRLVPGDDRIVAAEVVYAEAQAALEQDFDGASLTLLRRDGVMRYRARFEAGRRSDNVFVTDVIVMNPNERHRLTPVDWADLARGILLEIDRGCDGSVDERQRVGTPDPRYQSIYLPSVSTEHKAPSGASDDADLVPFRPDGWDAPVVPANVPGGHVFTSLFGGATTYIDFAVRNRGASTVRTEFNMILLVDRVQVGRQQITAGILVPGQWAEALDFTTTEIPSGWHTLRLEVDPDNKVPESDETNNAWEQDFYWHDGNPTPIPTAPAPRTADRGK